MLDEFEVQLVAAWHGTGWIEIIAAALAVAYLLLAIRQSILCWVAAFVSSCLYVWVLFGARLYMESALNGFYAAMAAYGFWQWRESTGSAAVEVHRWTLARNALGTGGHHRLVGGERLSSAPIHPRRLAVHGFDGRLGECVRHFHGGAQGV